MTVSPWPPAVFKFIDLALDDLVDFGALLPKLIQGLAHAAQIKIGSKNIAVNEGGISGLLP